MSSPAPAARTIRPPSTWDQLERALLPTEERPAVVRGIEVAHHVSRSGHAYVVIHNPVAHSYLKLEPRELDLVLLMNGTRTVKSLVVAYYQRHGVLALSRIAGLVEILRSHRFLTEPPLDAYAELRRALTSTGPLHAVAGAVHHVLEPEVSVDGIDGRLSDWYQRWGLWFFSKPVAIVGTLVGLAAPVFFLLELARPRYGLFQTGGSYLTGLLVLAVFQAVTLVIHELGHGLAVKHAGRTVGRAGMLLYFGLPVAFLDTTDVWMAPRRKRVLTSLAGPWTGLVLSGFCTTGAFLLPEGPVGSLLFAWGFVLLFNTLVNFNPLWRWTATTCWWTWPSGRCFAAAPCRSSAAHCGASSGGRNGSPERNGSSPCSASRPWRTRRSPSSWGFACGAFGWTGW